MGAADAWHPGEASVAPKWAVPIALLADETISSWLVRAALTYGCSPVSLTSWIWPQWRAWTTDVDRGLSEDRLATLAKLCGISTGTFQAASLAPIATRIEGAVPDRNRRWRWILPRGGVSRTRQGSAQYCRECLADDWTPHYRVAWRLAWHTACAAHGTALADRCGRCGAALTLHRLNASAPHAATCGACGGDLREGRSQKAEPSALAFQNAGDRTIRDSAGPCLGERVDAATWIAVAEFLITLVRRIAREQTRAMSTLVEALGLEDMRALRASPGAAIERLQTGERARILGGVWRVMNGGVEDFQNALRRSGVSRQAVLERKQTAPTPLAPLLSVLPENGRTRYARRTPKGHRHEPRSRREVIRMMRRLERALEAEQRCAD